jgi:hypothetical protein
MSQLPDSAGQAVVVVRGVVRCRRDAQVADSAEEAFTAAIRDGHTTGSPWIALIPAMGTALITALAIGGTHRRLAEYR